MPFGLGERRLGEPDPDVSPVIGLAMGAGGAIGARGAIGAGGAISGAIGTIETGRATGPWSARDVRLEGPGANMVGEARGFCEAFEGGPMGVVGARGRPKPGSKGAGEPKLRGRADGAREGGGPGGGIDGP